MAALPCIQYGYLTAQIQIESTWFYPPCHGFSLYSYYQKMWPYLVIYTCRAFNFLLIMPNIMLNSNCAQSVILCTRVCMNKSLHNYSKDFIQTVLLEFIYGY